MHKKHTILIGKAVKRVAELRGGGTALPGLVVEKMDRNFVGDMLANLPKGVVVVTGTNGKTTTTKIISEVLGACGLKVFTNKTGSNFVRGIAAAILGEVGTGKNSGKLPHDIAVLELDEAHAVQFIKNAPVHHALILNVMRDQLDRFGEIDYTAKLLAQVVAHASQHVILNRDDPRIAALAGLAPEGAQVSYFGADPSLHHVFVNDDKLHQATSEQPLPPANLQPASVELAAFQEHSATFRIAGTNHQTGLQLTGVYNFLNAAGALALCKVVLGDQVTDEALIAAVAGVQPAFGRGETLMVNGAPLELVLVKNPSGFRLALASFDPADTSVMITINDNYADGRDMSWLWDVDFTSLQEHGVHTVSGIRAYDMALRLHYDNVGSTHVEPDLKAALDAFLASGDVGKRRIFCTYTAMLKLRRLLRKYTKLEIMG
ncbi:MAG TPA: MurT ligase domain-containing protein [Candidatus Saccharimonadales bacterium]|nr:MurT ligase domain-containing protein [Candidatus Saccharimonadales bacterium]